MWVEMFYKVTFRDEPSGSIKEAIISAPYEVVRIKEILLEVHPSWEIQDIIPIRGIQ